ALEQVAAEALQDQRPATLWWTVGEVGFATNRRPQGGPVDHSLPVLVVKDAADDSVRAIYTSYACHCVTLSNNLISGDWAGYAQRLIESQFPNATAMVSIGCGSDANPSSGVTGDKTAVAGQQGAEIADEVARLLRLPLRPIHGKVKSVVQSIPLPLNPPPSREELEKLTSIKNAIGYNAQYQLEKLDQNGRLLTEIDYPIQTVEFGDSLAMVFLAGEVCCDYAVRLRNELDCDKVWLHGYSNDFCCYIPSERLLREGGYGGGAEVVYFALPNTLAPGLEDKITSVVGRQLTACFVQPGKEHPLNSASLSPEQSLATLKTKPGMTVEVVACEPLITDPVAIDFAPDGRLWVAEMPDYSKYPEAEFEQHGRVRRLSDANGDGRFDNAETFVDGLRFPTDVKAWQGGVIVCDAPHVLYFEDTDHDGKADLRQVWLSGFDTRNAQARVNSIRWGLDNWLYGSCGLLGGTIRTPSGSETVLGQRDFRFRPVTWEFEPVSGRTQQGRACNDYGEWFGCENSSLLDHYPMDDRYLARNPRVSPPAPEKHVPVARATRLHPKGDITLFKLSGPAGRPTSVCGLGFYRDDLLGAEYTNNAFVAEPVNQLVHRLVLKPSGVTYTGDVAEDEVSAEFLASSDPWFRPVQVLTGPDGCLYVVDMHRAVIEHPRFIPEETLSQLDVMAGHDQGRIFRVRPADKPPRQAPDLTQLDGESLAAVIDSPNGVQRDHAHETLVQRQDQSVAPHLRSLARNAQRVATRVQALCVLDALGAVDQELLASCLRDPAAQVRQHAVRLSEPYLPTDATLADLVLQAANDRDNKVRLQVAYSLGEWKDDRATAALAEMARRSATSPYILAGVWSSVSDANSAEFLARLIDGRDIASIPPRVLQTAVSLALASHDIAQLPELEQLLAANGADGYSAWQLDAARQILRRSPGAEAEVECLRRLVDYADTIVADGAPTNLLAPALQLVATAATGQDCLDQIELYLDPSWPPAVQQTAAAIFTASPSEDALGVVIESWPGLARQARQQAFDAIAGSKKLAERLLDALESRELEPSSLDAAQRQRLADHKDAAVRARAAVVLSTAMDANRAKIVREYLSHLQSSGDAGQGKVVFEKNCSTCHELAGMGHEVGPDLAALTTRTPEAFVESIFDPNRAVDDRYRSYTALTVDGLAYTGVLIDETATSVTLADQQGNKQVLLRADLDSLAMSKVSLMPEGLEREISPAQLNDLLAFLLQTTSAAGAQGKAGSPGPTAQKHDSASTRLPRTLPVKADAPHCVREIAQQIDLSAVGAAGEYEFIPKVWELSRAVGRRNELNELSQLLNLALPRANQPIAAWQIVLIGGGIVGGISEARGWPAARVADALAAAERPTADWLALLEHAAQLANDNSVRAGTRYDALRILGAASWQRCHEVAGKFLDPAAHPDLQLGAVQAIADVDSPHAAGVLIAAVQRLDGEGRRAAVEGLLRTDERLGALAGAILPARLGDAPPPKQAHQRLRANQQADAAGPANLN
ncbi:MAG: c-type cytochrome, partial [Planctomycetales bacterium]|nr:c-type cytochrome [Planctomycetales bacterium]